MKDNKKNLSNESLESVAGGKLSQYTSRKKKLLQTFLGYDKAMDLMGRFRSDQLVKEVNDSLDYTDEQKKAVSELLGKKR